VHRAKGVYQPQPVELGPRRVFFRTTGGCHFPGKLVGPLPVAMLDDDPTKLSEQVKRRTKRFIGG
jgi:hypothetical protein